MNLRDYQRIAIDKLKSTANSLLELHGNKTIVFEAPTGSGKTMMMAEFLKEFVENREDGRTFSFVWTAPRKLHEQSKEKLEYYYFDTKALRCLNFEDLNDKEIGENEILFLNWESINKADNIYIRENETDFNLSHIISNTVDRGRIIILIIDESHFGAATETSMGLIQMLQPKIAIDVSATPDIQRDEHIKVYREKVIAEGMIKKQIALNPGFKNIIKQQRSGEFEVSSSAAKSTNEIVIKAALQKRQELQTALKSVGSNVNPLTLIQLPDRRQGAEDIQDEVIHILKDNYSITTANGKLAIYLSEDKANLENITKNDGEAEVMIFKQAIALGWDCPRASILVLFRDWKSITFSIQTLGRILRMPELKHHDNDELNTGYVYTNLDDISIQEDIAGNYLTTNYAKRKPIYLNITLQSVHSKRFREETRLNPQFITDFLDAAKEMDLKNKINVNVDEIKTKLISDGLITNLDKPFEHLTTQAQAVEVKQTEMEIQYRFDFFIRDSLSPLHPEKRSIDKVKQGIYRFFKHEFPTMFEYNGTSGQIVVLYEKNKQHFLDTINRAKDLYTDRVGKGKKELIVDAAWEVLSSATYNNGYSSKEVKLSILEPFYQENNASEPERKFVEYLESKSGEIEWWFKNGDQGEQFFAVPYTEEGQEKPFYVDWIVKYKNGKIGLFDTKSGIYADKAKDKAEGLAKYINEQNSKGKNLFGGIVIQKDRSWRVNEKEVYYYQENELADWRFI
jgi:type III restriction enzyme